MQYIHLAVSVFVCVCVCVLMHTVCVIQVQRYVHKPFINEL